ncbi:MAG: 4Fe-4S dicluster-binding protein [Candidatus Bathyarchaeota archaeon]
MAEALNKLPNGFPRTESGVELEILKRIFSEPEAKLASTLTREYESAKEIAERNHLDPGTVKEQLEDMSKKSMLWTTTKNSEPHYRLAPWIVGIYEAQLDSMDHSFAHLVEDYFHEGGMEGLMKPLPSIHRVVPAQGAVKSEWVLPYDDVKAILLKSKVFHVSDCICRTQQDHVGRRCDFPVHNCLSFLSYERPPRPGDITKEEALALLDETERVGLVHTVSNVMEGINYVCNCCGCCCGILRGLAEFGYENSVAVANYYAEIDCDACIGCGVCEQRCQVDAVELVNDKAMVNLNKCIGCGLCVTGCPVDAAKLCLKPEHERIDPPIDYGVWEERRIKDRGLA